jgi:hypothetical protein
MARKTCELCGEHPAEVPDRDRPGRPIKRVCRRCHAARLRGDLSSIMERRRGAAGG